MHLENCKRSDDIPTVQTARDMTASNGCKVKLIFGKAPDPKIRREVAGMLLAAFRREIKEGKA